MYGVVNLWSPTDYHNVAVLFAMPCRLISAGVSSKLDIRGYYLPSRTLHQTGETIFYRVLLKAAYSANTHQ